MAKAMYTNPWKSTLEPKLTAVVFMRAEGAKGPPSGPPSWDKRSIFHMCCPEVDRYWTILLRSRIPPSLNFDGHFGSREY